MAIRLAGVFTAAVLAVALSSSSQAQDQDPERDAIFATGKRVVDIGNVGLAFERRGYIGQMFGSGTTNRPSFEYPLNSGVEHLWSAGLWVGALDDEGRPLVSTGVIDATLSAGSPDPSGFEFGPAIIGEPDPDGDTNFVEDPLSSILISRNPLQDNFRLDALADQHFILRYGDAEPTAGGADRDDITNPHIPLGVQVRCDVLALSSRFADSFVIMLFEVENVGDRFLEDLYLGWYVEPLVVNRGELEYPASGGDLFFGDKQGFLADDPLAIETASEFFSSTLIDRDRDARLLYRFDADGDQGAATSWSGARFLGADAPEGFDFSYRQWRYSSGGGIRNERDYGDAARYAYMRGCDPAQDLEDLLQDFADGCRGQTIDAGRSMDQGGSDFTAEANWVGLMSVGPWPSLLPGEKARFAIAMVAGATPDDLLANSAVAQFNYDVGFAVPSPPPSPRLTVTPRSNQVELRWQPGDRPADGEYDPTTASPEFHRSVLTNEFDFQGYRIYRLDGSIDDEDVTGDPFEQSSLIAEFDIATTVDGQRDRRGFNTGLPPMVDGERVFVDRNVLNGFTYTYAVTSYTAADPRRELGELESGFNENAVAVTPGSGPTGTSSDPDAEQLDPVTVYPNPYRAASIYDDRFSTTNAPEELGRAIYFANVPPRANIDVYNLSGSRIVRLVNSSAGSTIVKWNVMSEPTRPIAPGLYVWAVEDIGTGDVQRGKLVILK